MSNLGGRARNLVLWVAAAGIANACASSSDARLPGVAGAAGAETSAAGGTSAANAGAPAELTGGAGASASAGAAGALTAGASGQADLGGSGGAHNIFIDQIVIGQGGGPPRCLPRTLPDRNSASAGQFTCFIAEFKPTPCDCTQAGRTKLPPAYVSTLEQNLVASGACGGTSGVSCDSLCGCEIEQTSDSELDACQNDLMPAATANGFCVIDLTHTDENGAPAPLGNPALVSQCPANEKRLLRFVNAGQPAPDSTLFIGCWQ